MAIGNLENDARECPCFADTRDRFASPFRSSRFPILTFLNEKQHVDCYITFIQIQVLYLSYRNSKLKPYYLYSRVNNFQQECAWQSVALIP